MDQKISELAQKYTPLAAKILAETVRIPADHVAKDPKCGLSNHEGPRLEYLRNEIIRVGAVERPEDVGFDAFGNLVWSVEDRSDGVPTEQKTVIFFDGHTDTVNALRERWREAIGGGIDAYDGWTDPKKVDREFLKKELGHLPPENEWSELVFGRGSADQLSGVVMQIIATKILLELRAEGSLRGVVIRSIGTVTEEDNDGGAPMYLLRKFVPEKGIGWVPDAVILTEGTGDAKKGAVGIYRGQRGRMQIEVEVTGKSCHGSMPWEGRNPLEYGGLILAEAAEQYRKGEGFKEEAFLGPGTRTASWAELRTPSDCAVPERFTFRFDRRLTIGEDPQACVKSVESLSAVARTRKEGLSVSVKVPLYQEKTWRGYLAENDQIYPGWVTPESDASIRAAVDAYKRTASPLIDAGGTAGMLRKDPRVDRWIFSTDGVGYLLPSNQVPFDLPKSKGWIESKPFVHPPMFGIGPGIEQNTHKIGECVDRREFAPAVATMVRFPSLFRELKSR